MLTISKDKSKLDVDLIHSFLTDSYWAKNRTKQAIEITIEHSRCYGVYLNEEQIGFGRLVTDYYVFAYLMDIFILPAHRGNGYATRLMDFIVNDKEIKNVKNWFLRTSDAHGLYRKFGFIELENPDRTMVRRL